MSDERPPGPAHEHAEDLKKLRGAAEAMGVNRIRAGWFRRIVSRRLKMHATEVTPATWEKLYPGLTPDRRAEKRIGRAARRASAAGAAASLGAASGELLALVTEGFGAPVGLPTMALSMTLEAGYTTLLQIELACDIASIYGVPFDADDLGEVATLFGLSLGIELKKSDGEGPDEGEEPAGLTARLIHLEEGEVATRIGRKLLEDAFVRNVIPVAGVAISARWNYVGTKRLGATVKRYVRYRQALVQACKRLGLASVTDPALLVEGAWLLATVDGDAGHEEVLAIALIMDQLPEEKRRVLELDRTLGDDEEGWFEALSRVPVEMHAPLLDTLYLIAATDKQLEAAERRFLRRVGRALGREIDLGRVQSIARHLARGEALPADFLSSPAATVALPGVRAVGARPRSIRPFRTPTDGAMRHARGETRRAAPVRDCVRLRRRVRRLRPALARGLPRRGKTTVPIGETAP